MKIANIRKIYQGKVDLKDYFVEDAIRTNQSIRVIYTGTGESMTLDVEELKNLGLHRDQEFVSQFKKKGKEETYKLISYKWIPDNLKNDSIY